MARKRKTKSRNSKRRTAKSTLSAQGTEIMKIAKRIRKENPRKKWTTCVKEAGKEFKRKK